MNALLLFLAAAALPLGAGAEPAAAGGDGATVVYLVRHAEPVYPPPADDPRDPPLDDAGRARAEQLAQVLRDAGITGIFSTDYRRTRETARPLAGRLGLEVERYDPSELAALAERLQGSQGRFLVSGHSNTTPELVRLLGGDPGPPIDEETEFDRLYVVTVEPGRATRTLLLHYGPPPRPWPPPGS